VTPPAKLAPGLLLTGCAGFVDAIGFVELHGAYISFMSGNTTRLGTVLAAGDWLAALLPAALIAMFFIGGFAGSFVAVSARRWGSVLVLGSVVAVMAVSIGLSLSGFTPAEAMIGLAFVTGAQNAILQPAGSARLGATFVTGTLFAAAQDLAHALRRKAPAWRWVQHILVWASLCLGGLAGAMGDGRWGIPALLLPAAIYLHFFVGSLMGALRQPGRSDSN